MTPVAVRVREGAGLSRTAETVFDIKILLEPAVLYEHLPCEHAFVGQRHRHYVDARVFGISGALW